MRDRNPPDHDAAMLKAENGRLKAQLVDAEERIRQLTNRLRRHVQHREAISEFICLWRGYRDQLIADHDTHWRIETHCRFSVYLPLGNQGTRPYLDSRYLYHDSDAARDLPVFGSRTSYAQAWYIELVAASRKSLAVDLTDAKAVAALRLDPELFHRLVNELRLQSMIMFPLCHQRELGAVVAVESMAPMGETQFDQEVVRKRLAGLPNDMHQRLQQVYLPATIVDDVAVVDWLA